MKFLPLVWLSLWRRPLRTALTVLSLAAAFALLGLLHAMDQIFTSGYGFAGAERVMTWSRANMLNGVPAMLAGRIEELPGVSGAMPAQGLRAWYQDPKNIMVTIAVEPQRWRAVLKEWQMPEDQYRAWLQTRTGAIVGRPLAERLNLKIGDKVPLFSQRFARSDGSRAWTFDIVGIFDTDDPAWLGQAGRFYMRYDYVDAERVYGKGTADVILVQLHDPGAAATVSRQIDALTANSANETRSQPESAFALARLKELGNVSMMARTTIAAVFLAMLMVVATVMNQALRERLPELAVLKTLGFTDGAVLALVLAEALALCATGGLIGLSLSAPAMDWMVHLAPRLPVGRITPQVWLAGLAAILALALAVGVRPALRARRLTIVEALRA